MSLDAQWYVAQTHAHAESRAATHLVRQGFSIYLPRYMKRRTHARRIETVAAPLFPRYVFVAVDRLTQRWRSIQSTIGVSHLVCNGAEPVPVPNGVIAELRSRENEAGCIHLTVPPRFAAGDRVSIVDGVFSGSLGLFQGMADRDRVAILLELLGRKVRVVLDGQSVVAA